MTRKIRPCTCYVAEATQPDAGVLAVHVGCGRTTHGEFAPGHDAKLKSLLIQAHRDGVTLRITDLLGQVAERTPMAVAAEREWEDFLTHTLKATKKVRSDEAKARMIAEVESWGWARIDNPAPAEAE